MWVSEILFKIPQDKVHRDGLVPVIQSADEGGDLVVSSSGSTGTNVTGYNPL